VVSRVARICAQPGTTRDLRVHVVDALRRSMTVDAYAFVMTDPETEVGIDPLADVPCLPELPSLIRLKYLTEVNRWTSLGQAAGLRAATGDRPSRSPLWRDLLSRYDIGDVASVVFRDRFGCWGFLDLWRAGRDARFGESEIRVLAEVATPVTTALRRAQAATMAARPAQLTRSGPVVLLLSAELQVQGQTAQASEYLRTLLPPPGGAAPVPAAAYNVAAQLLACEAGIDTHPPVARVHLADGQWLTVRAGRLEAEEGIAVTIETASPAERSAVFARAFGLSARESELLAHLAAGCETREIAAMMFLSEYTVQDHLKSIFARTGLRTRRALISLIAGS